MWSYAFTWGSLFSGGVLASVLGLAVLGMALFPVPVAAYWARRQREHSLGLVVCAMLVGLAGHGSGMAMVYYGLVASLGLLLGQGIAVGWSYGWTVAVVVAAAYGLVAGHTLLFWEAARAQARAGLDSWSAYLAQQVDVAEEGPQALMLEQIAWLGEHWAEVGLGLMFWPVLLAACAGLSLTASKLRRLDGAPALRGSFREMRTPEWVIWAAIVLAALWFVDRTWPSGLLRLGAWNAAFALSAVYWLNGLSILAYAFKALQPSLFVAGAVVVVLFLFGVHPVLCFVGLFDTWGDFRRSVARLAAARKRAQQALDDDTYDDDDS